MSNISILNLDIIYIGHTQKNGAVVIVFTIKTAPFFCVCPVYLFLQKGASLLGSIISSDGFSVRPI
jgi:hypothetical protein